MKLAAQLPREIFQEILRRVLGVFTPRIRRNWWSLVPKTDYETDLEWGFPFTRLPRQQQLIMQASQAFQRSINPNTTEYNWGPVNWGAVPGSDYNI